MNQVECRLAPFEIAGEGFGVRKIRLPDLHSGILSPFAALQLRRRADETTNGVTRIEQTRSEPSADVAGGSRNRDTLPIRAFRHRLIRHSYELGSGLLRLLQPADVEFLRLGFIDELIVCGLVHLARSRQNPKVFPGWVAHQRIRVIRRERNDLIVSPDLWNKGKESRSEPYLQDRIRLSFAGNARHTLCLDLLSTFQLARIASEIHLGNYAQRAFALGGTRKTDCGQRSQATGDLYYSLIHPLKPFDRRQSWFNRFSSSGCGSR